MPICFKFVLYLHQVHLKIACKLSQIGIKFPSNTIMKVTTNDFCFFKIFFTFNFDNHNNC